MNNLIKVEGATGCFSGISLVKQIRKYKKGKKNKWVMFYEANYPFNFTNYLVRELTITSNEANKQRKKLSVLNLSMINFFNLCKEELPYDYTRDRINNWLGLDISLKLNKFISELPKRFYRIEIYEPQYQEDYGDDNIKTVFEIISFSESVITYATRNELDPELVRIFKKQVQYKTNEDYDDYIDNWAKRLLGRDKDEEKEIEETIPS